MGWGETLDKELSKTVVEPTQTVVEPAVVAPVTTEDASSWGATLDNEPISEPKVKDDEFDDDLERKAKIAAEKARLEAAKLEAIETESMSFNEIQAAIAEIEEQILISEIGEGTEVGGRDEAGNLLPVAGEAAPVVKDVRDPSYRSGFAPTISAFKNLIYPFVNNDGSYKCYRCFRCGCKRYNRINVRSIGG